MRVSTPNFYARGVSGLYSLPGSTNGRCRQFSRTVTQAPCGRLRSLQNRGHRFCTSVSITYAEFENAATSVSPVELEQRTQEWLDIRKDRLTASTFSNALGLFKGKRITLWEEKVGLRKEFKGNTATRWGVDNEAAAVEKYKSVTGHLLDHIGFKIYKDAEADAEKHSWLGASPDGLIEGNESGLFDKKGVLEVKCPHMRGRTNAGIPWATVPYYYIPQAQGLLEILDRDWMDFYVWTGKASASFRVTRDLEYWEFVHEILSEFWWSNVIPARKAKEAGEDVKAFKPAAEHPQTALVVKRSKELGKSYPLIWRDVGGSLQPLQAGLNLTLSILASTDTSAEREMQTEAEGIL